MDVQTVILSGAAGVLAWLATSREWTFSAAVGMPKCGAQPASCAAGMDNDGLGVNRVRRPLLR